MYFKIFTQTLLEYKERKKCLFDAVACFLLKYYLNNTNGVLLDHFEVFVFHRGISDTRRLA